jgi:hypothetical protein
MRCANSCRCPLCAEQFGKIEVLAQEGARSASGGAEECKTAIRSRGPRLHLRRGSREIRHGRVVFPVRYWQRLRSVIASPAPWQGKRHPESHQPKDIV